PRSPRALFAGCVGLRPCAGTGDGGARARTAHAVVVDRRGVDGPSTIPWVGPRGSAPAAHEVLDVGGRCVLPGFVDSHAHLVFAGDRSAEFAARMAGERYDGGGIGVTVEATRAASDEELREGLATHIAEMRAQGTT